MLTRPGSRPGSSWMKRVNKRIPRPGPVDPQQATRYRRWMIAFWSVWLLVMLLGTQMRHLAPPNTQMEYRESSARIAGLPLYAYGEHPQAIVAVGRFPVGVISLGGVPVGIVAVGGVAVGVFALGGVSLGILSFAGLAIGWWAVGGGAVGYHAFGGLAVGGYAYAGSGVALGYHEASGYQKEKLFG